MNPSGLGVQRDVQRQRAVAVILESMPFGAVWDYYCLNHSVPVGMDFMKIIKDYEEKELSKRS